MLDFISHLGGNGWTVKNSGGAEARKPKGQPNDTRHGEQEGTMLYIMSNCTDTRCLILLSLSLSLNYGHDNYELDRTHEQHTNHICSAKTLFVVHLY